MTQQHSPRRSLSKLGCLMVSLALTFGGMLVRAQQPKPGGQPPSASQAKGGAPKGDSAKGDDPKGEPAKGAEIKGEAAGVVDTAKLQGETLEERYEDPKAQAVLENNFPEISARLVRPEVERQIDAMASGQQAVDKNAITAFVQAQVAQLTSHANIAAMLEPTAPYRPVKVLEDAGTRLTRPLNLANQNNALEFRAAFTQALLQQAPNVLKNHLYARLMLMVALSRSGDATALPLFNSVLRDQKQPLAVQMLAAVGITRVANNGLVDVVPARAIESAKALAEFLQQNTPSFWPAQYRAIQALGSLRQSSSNPLQPDPDLSATVLSYLADPDGHPMVRAWAAWALGMMRPSPQATDYNVLLLALWMGHAAGDIGQRIVEVDATNPELSARLGALLLQVVSGLDGEESIRNSGLLQMEHPNVAAQRRPIQGISERVRGVARAAIDVTRSAGGQRGPSRQALEAAVQELRALLEKTQLPDARLYSDGEEYPPRPKPPTPPPAPAEAAKAETAPAKAESPPAEKAVPEEEATKGSP